MVPTIQAFPRGEEPSVGIVSSVFGSLSLPCSNLSEHFKKCLAIHASIVSNWEPPSRRPSRRSGPVFHWILCSYCVLLVFSAFVPQHLALMSPTFLVFLGILFRYLILFETLASAIPMTSNLPYNFLLAKLFLSIPHWKISKHTERIFLTAQKNMSFPSEAWVQRQCPLPCSGSLQTLTRAKCKMHGNAKVTTRRWKN